MPVDLLFSNYHFAGRNYFVVLGYINKVNSTC
jgi:hypothetical protein